LMVGAKQLRTLGLSWFQPEPYVQQGCARGTILLCTGVPVVARLQARRERRRGHQVPRGMIEENANIVGKTGSVRAIAIRCLVPYISCLPLRRGGSPSFYRPRRERFTGMPHYFSYVWRYGVQFHGDDARPGESCSGHGVVACPVFE
jgi:hypothetical protein